MIRSVVYEIHRSTLKLFLKQFSSWTARFFSVLAQNPKVL